MRAFRRWQLDKSNDSSLSLALVISRRAGNSGYEKAWDASSATLIAEVRKPLVRRFMRRIYLFLSPN